jgi:carbonic anhydrase/acetyltransferase-like protein (isoleucine patch superfamily)
MERETMTGPTLIPINGKMPRIHDSAFIAAGVVIAGDVEIGPEASVWYNCVIRADINYVRIGARSNIQDGTVIHCDSPKPGRPDGYPTLIGNDVLIGHMAMIHGCTLHDGAFIGLGTIVMDGCVVEGNAMLAAGAMLTPGKHIPAGQMWQGRPAKYARDLTPDELVGFGKGISGYVENARLHKAAARDAITAG